MSKRPIHITKYATLDFSFTFHKGYKHMKDLPIVDCGQSALEILHDYFSQHCSFVQEYFVILFLNRGNRVLAIATIGRGTAYEVLVDIPYILALAISIGAYGLIACHNHVSGNIKPSHADNVLTKKLSTTCKTIEIELLDHIIISDDPELWYSYAIEKTL